MTSMRSMSSDLIHLTHLIHLISARKHDMNEIIEMNVARRRWRVLRDDGRRARPAAL